jgi:hypothetical protein
MLYCIATFFLLLYAKIEKFFTKQQYISFYLVSVQQIIVNLYNNTTVRYIIERLIDVFKNY